MKTINEYLFSKKSDLDKIKTVEPNRFGITEKDMIRDLKEFPVGVVVRMLEETEKQGGDPDVKVFQRNKWGGFSWKLTADNDLFWADVINSKNFNVFYKRYPEYKKYDL